jgi:Putative zinc-finger
MTTAHDPGTLAAYALRLLNEREVVALDEHLAGCATCRAELAELQEEEAMLGSVPDEAFIEGPPPGGDLVLQRTLRRIRAESGARTRWRNIGVAAAAVLALAAAGGVGVVVGHEVETTTAVAQPGRAAPAGALTFSATDAQSGSRMTVTITPAAGWVRLKVDAGGIPAGERCRLVVVDSAGRRMVAGGWVVSPTGAKRGTSVAGSAAVAADDVAAVEIENEQGQRFVTVPA